MMACVSGSTSGFATPRPPYVDIGLQCNQHGNAIMDMADLQTQGGMASCAANYHATDTRVDRLIVPSLKARTGTCYPSKIITSSKS